MQFTADGETHAQLEELRALMRHQIPDGDVGKILAKAISVLLERVRKQKFAETSAPNSVPTSPPPKIQSPLDLRGPRATGAGATLRVQREQLLGVGTEMDIENKSKRSSGRMVASIARLATPAVRNAGSTGETILVRNPAQLGRRTRDRRSKHCHAKRSIAVFGSEKAARAAGEKARIEKYTRRFELLRKNAKEGQLPSLYLLASHPTHLKELQGIPGLPTRQESGTAYRTLYELQFPLAARMMAGECGKEIAEAFPETAEQTPPAPPELGDGRIQKHGTEIEIICDADPSGRGSCANPDEANARLQALEARRAEEDRREARRNAEIAERREACLDLAAAHRRQR